MEPGNSMQNLYKNTEELKVKKQKHNIFKEKKNGQRSNFYASIKEEFYRMEWQFCRGVQKSLEFEFSHQVKARDQLML